MKYFFISLLLEHFFKCKSRQQKRADTDGKSQSSITGYLTGTKRKETGEPSEQETQKKKAKHQKRSDGPNAIDPDLDESDCET